MIQQLQDTLAKTVEVVRGQNVRCKATMFPWMETLTYGVKMFVYRKNFKCFISYRSFALKVIVCN